MKNKKIIYSILAVFSVIMIAIPSLVNSFNAETNIATIDETKSGSITLHKYEQSVEVDGTLTHDGTEKTISPDAKPLPGVEFSIYYLGNNIGNSSYIKTVAEAELIANTVTPLSKITDINGVISFSGLTLGQYLVKETKSPENVSEKTPSFIVNVPTTVTIDNVDKWLYDINVYPKNQTIYGSVILTKINELNEKLPGAVFSLYAKGTAADVLRAENLETNQMGQLVVENLPKGSYYFVETKAPVGYGINSTHIEFTITASGKTTIDSTGLYVPSDANQKVEAVLVSNNKTPNIHKGVKSVTNQYAGYDFKENHEWVISPEVPDDIARYSKYIITDTIDSNLIFSGLESVKVYVNGSWSADSDGVAGKYTAGTLLTKDVDYKLTYDETTKQLKVVFIDSTFEGGKSILRNASSLYIFMNTTFDESKVSLGKDYPNKAELTYNNGYMTTDDIKESEIPKVHTGGLSLLKYTNKDTSVLPLPGAEFRIATSEDNAKKAIFVQVNGADVIATSNEKGIVTFSGLAYGKDGVSAETGSSEYWLVETKSPEINGVKYNLLNTPKKVMIDKTTQIIPNDTLSLSAWTYSVINNTGIKLPTTGGIGSLLFYLIGALLMGTSIVMIIKSKSKKITD